MNKEDFLTLLRTTGVVMDGHFLLTSGKHSDRFLQCARLMEDPVRATRVGEMLAHLFSCEKVDRVIGPAMGGVLLAHETARALGVRALFAEPEEGKMVLRRGFSLAPGERVLVVEDVVSTGGSVQKVLDLLASFPVVVVGVGIIIDRSAGKVSFGVPSRSLVEMEVAAFDPEVCPLCREGIPLHKPKAAEPSA